MKKSQIIRYILFVPYIIIKCWIICIVSILAILFMIFNIDIVEIVDNYTDRYSPI